MNGVLVIDKGVGPTSHDIVGAVRKILGRRVKKVGHTGTLDPAATGVLPLVLGQATKVARYLSGSDKSYLATVRLGVQTDTLDREGVVTDQREVPSDLTSDAVESCLERFRGPIDQTPPMYSAKKVEGKRLYELARQGVEVAREAKRVTIHRLKLLAVQTPDIEIEVICSAGTYVRVLAQEIGEVLGCGAHLLALRRTSAGPFTLDQAIRVEDLIQDPELAEKHLIGLSTALGALPSIEVPPSIGKMVASGHQLSVGDLRNLDIPTYRTDEAVALFGRGGGIIAIARTLLASEDLQAARRDEHALKTERVLAR